MPTPETLAKNAEREARKSHESELSKANKRAIKNYSVLLEL